MNMMSEFPPSADALGDVLPHTPLPPLYRVRQQWGDHFPIDIPPTIRAQLDGIGVREQVAGKRIAITAGSRGIHNIVAILTSCVAYLHEAGASPFLVPAMGSHGGATAEGQVQLLASLGITEAAVGCPIHSSMEVVTLGHLEDSTPVCMDRLAYEADGVLIINRIKPHTSFEAPIESGLAKMCAVGLGKRVGAELVHCRGVYGLRTQLVPMARMVVERGGVVAGLGILEDARKQTVDLVALPPHDIGAQGEATLLERSCTLMARLPFDHLDVLVVEEIGKNISGTGMDTNVIGRLRISGETEPATPDIRVIVALDLTDESKGNAVGVGLADLIPAQMVHKIDFAATYVNNLTAGLIGLQRGALPITLPTPEDAVTTAIRVCGEPDPAMVRLVRIRNTSQLDEFLVTAPLLEEVAHHPRLISLGQDEGGVLKQW